MGNGPNAFGNTNAVPIVGQSFLLGAQAVYLTGYNNLENGLALLDLWGAGTATNIAKEGIRTANSLLQVFPGVDAGKYNITNNRTTSLSQMPVLNVPPVKKSSVPPPPVPLCSEASHLVVPELYIRA